MPLAGPRTGDQLDPLPVSDQAASLVTDVVLDGLAWVESGGRAGAVGDRGKAVGLYQIHDIYRRDVNLLIGEDRFSSAERWDPQASREMTRLYLTRMVERCLARGYVPDEADILAMHRWGRTSWTPASKNDPNDKKRFAKYQTFKGTHDDTH